MKQAFESAWEDLDEEESPRKQQLYEKARQNAEDIIDEYGLEEAPELLVIGTSELGDEFVETSARGSGSTDTAPKVLQEASENGELVISTGWPEDMFYGSIAPEHGLEEADAVLESGGQIALHEENQLRTDITGEPDQLKEVTESIWENAVREAAEKGYKIHPQGNDVGAAVYVEAEPSSRGDLENTEQALESRERFEAEKLVDAVENEAFRTKDSPVNSDEEAIVFPEEDENIVQLYEAWKDNFPLLGLRLESSEGEITAYRDEKLYRDREGESLSEGAEELAGPEVIEYINSITPEGAHSSWNNDWNADIIPDDIPSKFEGLQYLAEEQGAEKLMIYADKTSDFPEDMEELSQYEDLTVLSVAVSDYSGEDAANKQIDLEIPNSQEAAYTLGALQSKLN